MANPGLGNGEWGQVGFPQSGKMGTRSPLVLGQPEQREYRVQGLLKNSRTG